MQVEVVLSPAEIAALPSRDLRESVCVVFDVLRASTTILTAFAHGARRIFPVLTVEEARQMHRLNLPNALLAGERGGERIDGFDLGNSPLEYSSEVVSGRDIISTTTNGTVALRACDGALEILVGAWTNTDALVTYLGAYQDDTRNIVLVCAGTGQSFALEDGLAAGALCACLDRAGTASHFNDAASAMIPFYRRWSDDPLPAMRGSANGKRLIQLGFEEDIAWCARTDASEWVATLRGGALEGRRVVQSFKPYEELNHQMRGVA